ncbi:unnamed protein product, partial [Notodromas monacha]
MSDNGVHLPKSRNVIICEAAFAVFTLYFTVQIGRGIYNERGGFFRKYWNLTELALIIISYIGIAAYFIRLMMTSDILNTFEKTHGNGYIRMDKVLAVTETYSQMLAGVTFLAMIIFIKLLRYNKRVSGLGLMFKICWDDLIGFAVIFFIFFLAFVSMFYMFFSPRLSEWNTYIGAASTSFSILLGKFEFGSIQETNVVASVFFFFFNIAMSIIMINLMLTIIILAFEQVEKLQQESDQDFRVTAFIWARAKIYFGIGTDVRTHHHHPADPKDPRRNVTETVEHSKSVQEFPGKIDKMLDYLTHTTHEMQIWGHEKDKPPPPTTPPHPDTIGTVLSGLVFNPGPCSERRISLKERNKIKTIKLCLKEKKKNSLSLLHMHQKGEHLRKYFPASRVCQSRRSEPESLLARE